MINPEIVTYVEAEIIPRYRGFDRAHGEEHVRAVIRGSLELADFCHADAEMAYVIAAYHDVGMPEGRDTHHLTSARILAADQRLRQWFSEEQILTMKEAVEDHRASSKNPPRTIYGRIVADADRDLTNLMPLKRTVQFGLKHYPELGREEQYERFCQHLQEKYAEGGYLQLWIAGSGKAQQLAQLREVIADPERRREAFNVFYERENSKLKTEN